MADVIVDSVGGPTLQSSIMSLAYRGRVSMVGQAGREPMKVDVGSMMGGNRTLSGVFLGAEIGTDRVQGIIQQLIQDVHDGSLRVVIDKTFPLKDAAEAHRSIESRQAVGRVLLDPLGHQLAFPVHGEGDLPADSRRKPGEEPTVEGATACAALDLAPSTMRSLAHGPPPPLRVGGRFLEKTPCPAPRTVPSRSSGRASATATPTPSCWSTAWARR